jgi:hypothetical protein
LWWWCGRSLVRWGSRARLAVGWRGRRLGVRSRGRRRYRVASEARARGLRQWRIAWGGADRAQRVGPCPRRTARAVLVWPAAIACIRGYAR